ncbi:hypothetical protein PCI56_11165 [Plesiomonas shigelloides subsp. oncorhynchi]|nr:hypothetical protein [Plesiomonas shigelloides]
MGGMEITLGGKPQVGDSFSIDMDPASGSNTNLLAMQDLQNSKIMGNGTQTLFDVYENSIRISVRRSHRLCVITATPNWSIRARQLALAVSPVWI